MPDIFLPVRLVRATVAIDEGQWFVIYPNDTAVPVSDAEADAMMARSPTRPHPGNLSARLFDALAELAAHKRPISAGKRNNSGQLSMLKRLGYAENQNARWSVTQAGRDLLDHS